MCSPATPTLTTLTSIPALFEAIDTASLIASAVLLMLATRPLCNPSEGATPKPSISIL